MWNTFSDWYHTMSEWVNERVKWSVCVFQPFIYPAIHPSFWSIDIDVCHEDTTLSFNLCFCLFFFFFCCCFLFKWLLFICTYPGPPIYICINTQNNFRIGQMSKISLVLVSLESLFLISCLVLPCSMICSLLRFLPSERQRK